MNAAAFLSDALTNGHHSFLDSAKAVGKTLFLLLHFSANHNPVLWLRSRIVTTKNQLRFSEGGDAIIPKFPFQLKFFNSEPVVFLRQGFKPVAYLDRFGIRARSLRNENVVDIIISAHVHFSGRIGSFPLEE